MLPHVLAHIDATGHLDLTVDGSPVQAPQEIQQLRAADLRQLVDGIAAELGCPVRVEVHQHGAMPFTDIVTPHTPAGTTQRTDVPTAPSTNPDLDGSAAPPYGFGVLGSGFLPGEQVSVAVVVSTQHADAHGYASLRMPPSLLARAPRPLVLLGQTSGTIVVSDPHDETSWGPA
ncbi:hypothetical protein [Georgenia yuyongxinii]|uniref:hypothetical protein n=1 Tax=Georgenia yuyongxinii TaxID=2589797 RepID=UPI001179A945|nr:hypothetical protein [Georgenia yuyongxinii]